TAAQATGTFSSNAVTAGQTVTITNGTTLTLTASDPTTATGTGTFDATAANFCAGNGQGVTINAIGLTTNAAAATGSITFSTSSPPANGSTITIGGRFASQTYKFVTSFS